MQLRKLKQNIGAVLIPRLPFNRRTFDIFRFELNVFFNQLLNSISPKYHKRIHAIENISPVNLNVGSGGRGFNSWINIDAMRHHKDLFFACDIRKILPIKSSSVDRIFAEHVIEHLDFRNDIPTTFSEFYRILKLGGRIRIIVPDGKRYAQAYVSGVDEEWKTLGMEELPTDMPTHMCMLNHIFHQGGEHLFCYDFETMKYALERAGFHSVEHLNYGVSRDSILCIDREEHSKYSLYVEALK